MENMSRKNITRYFPNIVLAMFLQEVCQERIYTSTSLGLDLSSLHGIAFVLLKSPAFHREGQMGVLHDGSPLLDIGIEHELMLS
jgi:hypothetical protein